MNKKEALAKYLHLNQNDIDEIYEDEFETSDGEEYLVLTEEEAYDMAVEDIKEIFYELGLEAFTPTFRDWIKENCIKQSYFEDWCQEDIESYYYDLDDDELLDEALNYGYIDEDDIENGTYDIESLRSTMIEQTFNAVDDYVQYFIDLCGSDYVTEFLTEHPDVIDIDAVADECISVDGLGHFLAAYDGKEIELDNNYYAYRRN